MKAIAGLLVVLTAAAAIGGCSNPEESARAALVEAGEAWQEALEIDDPRKRVAAYTDIIDSVASIVEDYPETPDGRAIAAGREVVGGRSLGGLRNVRDELEPRAACYSKPTVDCLTPFASEHIQAAASAKGDANSMFAAANEAVCASGFAAADRTLEPFKINKPVYAAQLIQVALAAAACDKPGEVVAAIDAYRAAVPGAPAERARQLLSIVSTDALKPAWPSVMTELEQTLESGSLPANDAASVVLTMAARYAVLGDTRRAVAKYKYFTDTLNYDANLQTKFELGAALIIAGAAEEGVAIVAMPNMRSMSVNVVSKAANELAGQLGLVREHGSLFLHNVKDIRDYFSPVAGPERQRVATSSSVIEAELDKLAPVVTIQDGSITMLDTGYGALALVQQKLGDADKATALIGKGSAFRARLLVTDGQKSVGLDRFNGFAALVALGQGRHAEAAELVQAINSRHDYARLILKSYAAKCELEQCLALANTIEPNIAQSYTTIIESLIAAGRLDDAERAMAAYAGNPDSKRGMYWMLAQQAATEGDLGRAEQLAEKYSLVASPQDRLRFLGTLLSSEKIGGNRRQAEPLIREIFTIGSKLDASGTNNRNAIAQNAAWHAFHNGYTDLGIELYTAASRKDQQPMFEAFNDKLKERDMPVLLMLAHDNLRGETLGYVINAAIRYLNREAV